MRGLLNGSKHASLKRVSTQEILLGEIKNQPGQVLRELRLYLEFLKRQRTAETHGRDSNGRSRRCYVGKT
jgi:hypothetical protein